MRVQFAADRLSAFLKIAWQCSFVPAWRCSVCFCERKVRHPYTPQTRTCQNPEASSFLKAAWWSARWCCPDRCTSRSECLRGRWIAPSVRSGAVGFPCSFRIDKGYPALLPPSQRKNWYSHSRWCRFCAFRALKYSDRVSPVCHQSCPQEHPKPDTSGEDQNLAAVGASWKTRRCRLWSGDPEFCHSRAFAEYR